MDGETLQQVLTETGDTCQDITSEAKQVFVNYGKPASVGRYHHLTDYVVTSSSSGPSLILMPRKCRG